MRYLFQQRQAGFPPQPVSNGSAHGRRRKRGFCCSVRHLAARNPDELNNKVTKEQSVRWLCYFVTLLLKYFAVLFRRAGRHDSTAGKMPAATVEDL